MRSQYLEALKFLVLVLHLLLNQLYIYNHKTKRYLLSMSFLSAGLRDSEISGSSKRIWSMRRSISVLKTINTSWDYSGVRFKRSIDLVSTSPLFLKYSKIMPGGWYRKRNLFSFILPLLLTLYIIWIYIISIFIYIKSIEFL